ncbi:MAG: FAD-dependent oxidoreductase [Oligosphaeraceae bacterium]|nr:FAD-dependent oxidoreductase [Oligosphaeraceae bacterium]
MHIIIPAETLPVLAECDLCVIGGSCTGVFAAIRAARLGAKVILLEKQNRLGGVATLGLVGMWHSLYDTTGSQQIIAGLTLETLQQLARTGACTDFSAEGGQRGIRLNPEELTLELDAMVAREKNLTLHLHTTFSRAIMQGEGDCQAIVAENKSGRFAIKAKIFLDASGDGVLCKSAQLPMRRPVHPQPPSSCARFSNWSFPPAFDLRECIERYRDRLPDLPCGYYWGMQQPNSTLYMLAGTRVLNCDCDNAEEISKAELTARRQIRALLQMLRQELPEQKIYLETLPAAIGIREGLHIESIGTLQGQDLLSGRPCPEAIANGTYPVDIHNDQDDSITFKRLDGSTSTTRNGTRIASGRWLPEGQSLPCYQIPLSCLIPRGARNILCAGRMLDADREAFGAVRVMVNLNQCGEAAGAAAMQALDSSQPVTSIDVQAVRKLLRAGGAIII